MRGGSIDGELIYGDLVCIRCFIEIAGDKASNWLLTARDVRVELETTTPSGRVWDNQAWLWVEPSDLRTQGQDVLRDALVVSSEIDDPDLPELLREDGQHGAADTIEELQGRLDRINAALKGASR